MGLIKTAMMSGVAIYGVKELSKAAQPRNNNNNNANYGPPPRRDPNYDDRRSYDQQGGDWSRREIRYDDQPSQYEPYNNDHGGDQKQRALAGVASRPSNQDYFNNGRYDDRLAYEYEENRQCNTPPPYGEYEQRRPRGYVEGEVSDRQSQRSRSRGGVEDVVGMLGSTLGGSGMMGGGKRRKGDREGDSQIGSLLSSFGKR